MLTEAILVFLSDLAIIARNVPISISNVNNFMSSASYFSSYLEILRPEYNHTPISPPQGFKCTSLENYLNYSIDLPFDSLIDIPNGCPSEDKSTLITSNIVTLLNQRIFYVIVAISSKSLKSRFPDYGKEKSDILHSHPYFSQSNRIPLGLPIQDYLAAMDEIYGISNGDNVGERHEKAIEEPGKRMDQPADVPKLQLPQQLPVLDSHTFKHTSKKKSHIGITHLSAGSKITNTGPVVKSLKKTIIAHTAFKAKKSVLGHGKIDDTVQREGKTIIEIQNNKQNHQEVFHEQPKEDSIDPIIHQVVCL
jgi:hypothetical protein